MKVDVDRDKCIGAGQCYVAAPEVFEQADEDGLVTLLVDEPGGDLQAGAREAANLCPALAIRVYE